MTRTRMTEQDIAKLGREALEQSVEHLDAHALSRLNQARQQALAATKHPALWSGLLPASGGPTLWGGWLPATAAGCAALALAIALPISSPVEQPGEVMTLPLFADDASMAALEDAELLEDLDMMLWLVDVENHAS